MLHSHEVGSGDDVVVLLHGFAGSHAVWSQMLPHLDRHARVLAYDLPGHGGSAGYPGFGPVKVASRAVLADLSARGHARVHLVGHSMGGAAAALCALFEPGRIASLTLLAPGGFGPQINARLLRRYAEAGSEAEAVAVLEGMFGWYSPIPAATVADMLARRTTQDRQRYRALWQVLMGEGRQGTLPLADLAATGIPMAVAWGGLDNVLPVRQVDGVPASFTVTVEPELGHMLPEEAPEAMVRLVLTSLGATAAGK